MRGEKTLSDSSSHGQWPVENGQADDFGFGKVRSVEFAFGGKKASAGRIDDAGFLPFARKDISGFVRLRMDMRGNSKARGEFAEDGDAAGGFILVQDHQLDAGVRAGMPFFIRLERDVLEHDFIQNGRGKNAMRIAEGFLLLEALSAG